MFEMTELEIWGNLSGRHPNILDLYGAVKSHGKVTIFMEYMEGRSIIIIMIKIGKRLP